jgi:hypothetical protein
MAGDRWSTTWCLLLMEGCTHAHTQVLRQRCAPPTHAHSWHLRLLAARTPQPPPPSCPILPRQVHAAKVDALHQMLTDKALPLRPGVQQVRVSWGGAGAQLPQAVWMWPSPVCMPVCC